MSTQTPSPAELRARIAFADQPIYLVAARAQIHPSRLSQMLHGHIPMPEEIARRVERALDEAPA
jgi:hypothetical protein